MSEERKATDVILDMEKKLDQVIKQLTVIDFNFKLVLNKLNQPQNKATPSVQSADIDFPSHEPKQSLKSKLELALEEAQVKDSSNYHPEVVRKIPVQQRICYSSDGRNVTGANVDIVNSSNVIVKQTKTNQSGKWMASLEPGEYKIKIHKLPTNIKPKVELIHNISVSKSDSAVELETIKA